MRASSELTLKIRIVKIGLAFRVLILLAAWGLYLSGGFLTSVFWQFMYILAPISCLYITLFLKFIYRNAYQYPVKGEQLSREYRGLGYWVMIGLNTMELLLIIYKAFNYSPELGIEDFKKYIAGIEVVFGFFAGMYISELFRTGDK